jgi:hypothetical protein
MKENPKPKPGNVSCDLSCFKPCSFCTDFVAVAKFMETHNLNQVMLKQTWRFCQGNLLSAIGMFLA